MKKYFSTVIICFTLAVLAIKLLNIDTGMKYTFSFYPDSLVLWLFGIFFGFGLVCFGLRALVRVLKNDVLLSNHAYHGDTESIEVIHAVNNGKIVLTRSQFDEAAILIVKTMSAVTAGVMNEAKRLLVSLRKIIGDDAIIDILMLKIYKGEKNFDKMEQLSQKLMQNEDIQLIGMKAALEAQMEKKEFTEALKTVNQAFEVRQDLYWVIGSAFLLRARNNDWTGALEVLNAGISKNITPPQKAARLRAVTLYELALQAQNEDSTKFLKFVTQALDANKRLVPAALDLADYYIQNDNQLRKAEKVLCTIWAENPTYDVAKAYLALFAKDTKAERIQRMEKLALMNNKRPSLNNLILAELFIDAKKYAKAETECKLFLLKNPATQKLAGMLSQIEEKSKKTRVASGGFFDTIKSYLNFDKDNSINNYPKDFQWVCASCGHTSENWQAICPQCGEVGRHYWHLYVDTYKVSSEDN